MNATATTNAAAALVACRKCNGRGKIAAFARVQGGTCFTCKGVGTVPAAVAKRAAAAAKAAATRAARAAAKAAARVEEKDAAALARHGDTFRLAVALMQFDHPHVHQASSLYCELRDGGNDDYYREQLTAKMPALVATLGLDGMSLDAIEARAAELRAARVGR